VAPEGRSPTAYAEVVDRTRRQAEKAAAVANKNARSAIVFSRAAGESMKLARLTGDYADFAKAEDLLTSAFQMKNAVPPYMLRAQLHYTLHRLDAAEADFKKHVALPNKTDEQRAAESLFAANLAFERGAYREAKLRYETIVEAYRTPSALAGLAYYHWRVAEFPRAEELYRESITQLPDDAVEPIAWTHLQLGLMDLERGRYADALAHYREGATFLSGYWLIDEHIAEILTLQGKVDEAKERYADIIERTGNPEFMDAMAGILQEEGDERGAKTFIDQADAAYHQRLARFPEATYGHALEHYLEFGEPAVALDLAQKNHALRPNTEAKVLLARAQLGAGKARAARKTVEAALATPIRMADLHAVAAKVYAATGDKTKADAQRDAARALNPESE
jgi:tetratricopeptide (TPR) repeat protein